MRTIAICGGGNAGHALAVIASQNFDGDVHWLVQTAEKAELLKAAVAADGLQMTGAITGRADRLTRISADPRDVIPDADVVIVAVPAFAHMPVLTRIAPHLKETVLVGCLPTRGGFEFDARRLIPGIEPNGRRVVFGLQTLPWSTRVVKPGAVVNCGAVKAKVMMASMPGGQAPAIAAELTQLLGLEVCPTAGFLNMTLGNPGQFIHPGLMFCLFQSWRGEEYEQGRVPLFYASASDQSGELVQELSLEAIAVAQEIARLSGGVLDVAGVQSAHDWLRMSYPTQTEDTSTVGACFRTGPLQVREAPMLGTGKGTFVPNLEYRYLREDVPYGLVVTRAIAQLVGVATPAIDTVIRWTQTMTANRHLANGSIHARDVRLLPVPQSHGIDSAVRLLEWYTEGV